jgi:hypothetical protein
LVVIIFAKYGTKIAEECQQTVKEQSMGEVVDFFSRASKTKVTTTLEKQETDSSKVDFSSIAEKNAMVQEKLRRERNQANQNVLKSYRIK